MPKITVEVSYGEMLDGLIATRKQLIEYHRMAQDTCGTTETFAPQFADLLDVADMGLAQINAAVQQLYNQIVDPANNLVVGYSKAVAACSQHCPLSQAAREELIEMGENVPPAKEDDPGDWMPDEGDYDE